MTGTGSAKTSNTGVDRPPQLLVPLGRFGYTDGYVHVAEPGTDPVPEAVWVWTIIITVLGAIAVAVAGSQFNILGSLGGLPQLPMDPAALSVAGIITAVAALLAILVGAILGGLAGMRFHRRIDRADLGH